MHKYTHRQTYILTLTHKYSRIYTQINTHAQIYIHTQANTRTAANHSV